MAAFLLLLPQILQGIQIGINSAPEVEAAIAGFKDWVAALFQGGQIDVATQNDMHMWVDGIAAGARLGIVPPAWQVQPDPVSQTSTTTAKPAGT